MTGQDRRTIIEQERQLDDMLTRYSPEQMGYIVAYNQCRNNKPHHREWLQERVNQLPEGQRVAYLIDQMPEFADRQFERARAQMNAINPLNPESEAASVRRIIDGLVERAFERCTPAPVPLR